MKRMIVLVLVVLVAAGVSSAAVNVPGGYTGLWRFQSALPDGTATMAATVGVDMVNSNAAGGNGNWMLGPWTDIGVEAWHTMYSDGGIVQDRAWDYLQVNPSFTANGGGDYVNQYTIMTDVYAGSADWFSLYQTSWGGNDSDGDLWIASDGTVGVGDVGYSTATLDPKKWHRIIWSVDNGNFFRVYVDGVLFLDGTPQDVDGRFSLYTDRFNLFADDSWEDSWILCGTVATWGRALTTAEIAPMGGWIGSSDVPTPLIVPEPATMSLLALGGIALLRRNRK
jgi:hypothetical protein